MCESENKTPDLGELIAAFKGLTAATEQLNADVKRLIDTFNQPTQPQSITGERVPSHLSRVGGKGRVGKIDTCKYCGGDYQVKAWNTLYCSRECSAKGNGFDSDSHRKSVVAKRGKARGKT